MSRGRRLLLAQRAGLPLEPPADDMAAEELAAWHEIVKACPPVLRRPDTMAVEMCAHMLAAWRRHVVELSPYSAPDLVAIGFSKAEELSSIRTHYRALGQLFMPMPERRRLLFPDRPRRAR